MSSGDGGYSRATRQDIHIYLLLAEHVVDA